MYHNMVLYMVFSLEWRKLKASVCLSTNFLGSICFNLGYSLVASLSKRNIQTVCSTAMLRIYYRPKDSHICYRFSRRSIKHDANAVGLTRVKIKIVGIEIEINVCLLVVHITL